MMYVPLTMLNGDFMVSEHGIGLVVQLLQGLYFKCKPVATGNEGWFQWNTCT